MSFCFSQRRYFLIPSKKACQSVVGFIMSMASTTKVEMVSSDSVSSRGLYLHVTLLWPRALCLGHCCNESLIRSVEADSKPS
jgi:hypothetical protein